MNTNARIERARILYERALFNDDPGALEEGDLELDAVEADLALARGRIIHGRFLARRTQDPGQASEDPRELELFERAARLYAEHGNRRGEAESLFWIGCFHQVVRRDNEAAVPVLDRSLELATLEDDKPVPAPDRRGPRPPLRPLSVTPRLPARLVSRPGIWPTRRAGGWGAAWSRDRESGLQGARGGGPPGLATRNLGYKARGDGGPPGLATGNLGCKARRRVGGPADRSGPAGRETGRNDC